MSQLPPGVSLIIPSYNDAALLERNLPAVLKAAGRRESFEIIVVNDASPDPGVRALAPSFPAIRWLHHERNQGFSGAIATGVGAATSNIVVLLNSDVAPRPDFLDPLIRPLEDPSVFAVSPLILDEQGEANGVSWNRYRFRGGRLRELGWEREAAVSVSAPLPTLYTSGGSMAVRKAYFQELGGFDTLYHPFYVEDLDLGVRAWRRGWRVLFEPRSVVVHQEKGAISTNVRRSKVKRAQRRNGLLFEWSHFPLWRILSYRGPYYLKQLIGRALRGDRDYLAGFGAALKHLPAAMQHRRHVNEISVRDFDAVLAIIERETAGI